MSIVQKYGGRYLSKISDIVDIAKFTAKNKKADEGLVLVMASIESISENILNNAVAINGDIKPTELDALFSAGEQQTAALMVAALQKQGIDAEVVVDIKAIAGDELNYAERKKAITTEKIERILSEGKVAVVAGFQGIGVFNAINTSGRGGAAATAVAIAAQLGCDCELYGNIDAVYSSDRELNPNAKVIKEMSYEEAMELILMGTGTVESRAIELAKIYNVSLYIGKPMQADKSGGTRIMNQNLIVEETPITGISVCDDVVIYTLKGVSNEGGAVAELFKILGDLNISVDMISQQRENEDTCTIAFSCNKEQTAAMDKAGSSSALLQGLKVSKQENLAMVSVIGVGMAENAGVASKVFSVLAEHGIKHYQITTSEICISVTVDADKKGAAVVALGEAFGL